MDNQPTINDLPLVCLNKILSYWITDREHRICARFVCKLWCALIDQYCSTEKYRINDEEIDCNLLCKYGQPLVDFRKIFSIFLHSQRKKTSYRFKGVDFRGSEPFWKTKGAEIISLYFGFECSDIPLSIIIEHCSMLNTLTFENQSCSYMRKYELVKMLEKCISDGKRNSSVRFLYFTHHDFVVINDIAVFTKFVSQVFLGVQKVFLDEPLFKFLKDNKLGPENVDLFSTAFKNLKFEITLKCPEGTFIFDPAGNVPVRMTTSKINGMLSIDNILTHLSHYPCDCNHLNRLDFQLMYRQNKLDYIQKLIDKWKSLKSIFIKTDSYWFIPLTKPLGSNKNNIDHLSLSSSKSYLGQFWAIDDAFLQFFENLRTFVCDRILDFSDFVKLLRKLPHLEKLELSYGSVSVNVDPVQTISNEKLLELKMPYSFLLKTNANYNFSNLKKLNTSFVGNGVTPSEYNPSNVYQVLSRMNCPKLEILELDLPRDVCWKNQDELTQWMLNILSLFSRLIKFLFGHDVVIRDIGRDVYPMNTVEEILKTILKNHRSLREIGWKFRSHRLKILSPSHIKHNLCQYGGSVIVLNVP